MAGPSVPTDRAPSRVEPRLLWWKEVLLVVGFYLVYTWVRNRFGSAAVDPADAYDNAEIIIDIERAMGSEFEDTMQGWFLGADWFLRAWNIFYGTFHFLVTGFALIYLYRRYPRDYPRWRTIGLTTTGLALVGFAAFPLMPPRLLGDCGEFGACIESRYVDTVAELGSWWTFGSGAMEQLSNQYAAMPSLHVAWALWSFLILAPRLRHPAARIFIWSYPWLTLFSIIVTGNHYWLDAVGGVVVLAVGYWLGAWLHRWSSRRLPEQPGPYTAPGA